MAIMHENGAAAREFLQREIPLRVHRYFPELSSQSSVHLLRGGRPLVRKHSVLFEFSVVDEVRETIRGLFVKMPKARSQENIRKTYEALVDVHRLCTELPAEFNVVRPLDFFPEFSAWATERVEGEELGRLLRRPSLRSNGVMLVKDCGRFLRRWHEARAQGDAGADYASSFLNECRIHLARLQCNGVEDAKRVRVRKEFESAVERLAGSVPACLTPKDFNVRNIVVREGRIFLMEVTEPRIKAVYEDIAAFLNSLTMLFWHTLWMFFGAQPSPTLTRAFLQGYFCGPVPLGEVSLFCAKHLCLRWNGALEALSTRIAERNPYLRWMPLRSAIDRFFYRHVIAHLEAAQSLPSAGRP